MEKKEGTINFEEYILISEIDFSDSSHIFNKKKIILNKKFYLEDKYNNGYLALKNHKYLVISENHSQIESDEILIFKTNKKEKENLIELINFIDRCEECTKKQKFYEKVNNLFFKLWISIQKIDKEENITKNNENLYLYYLKENDIIRLGKILLILRKFHKKEENNCDNNNNNDNNNNDNNNNNNDNNNNNNNGVNIININNNNNNNNDNINNNNNINNINDNNNNNNNNTNHNNDNVFNNNNFHNNNCKKEKRQFTMVLESYEGLICSICNKNYIEENNPIIKLCECEKYRHFKCMKEEIRNKKKQTEKNGCISYSVKTNCLYCKKYIPLTFYVKEGDKLTLYELLDIPLDDGKEYLLFETLDFQDNQNEYNKYFFYVEFRKKAKNKNIETILIGADRNKTHKYNRFDKLMKIDHGTVSSEHAIIEYDLEEQKLILKNISDTHNTLILENSVTLKSKDDNLVMELGNIRIKSKLMERKDYEKINNKNKEIEERGFDDD